MLKLLRRLLIYILSSGQEPATHDAAGIDQNASGETTAAAARE